MIKSYFCLTQLEKFGVLTYLNRSETIVENIEALDALYKLPIYLNGKGALFLFDDNKRIIASLNIILKEAKPLGTAYIHKLDCLEGKEIALKELIERAKMVATYLGAKEIYIGANTAEVLLNLDLEPQYRSLIMNNQNPTSAKTQINLIPITSENQDVYVNLYEDSFYDIPHAATFNHADLETKQCFIATQNNEPIGFINFEIENNEGYFDLGLKKQYQNKKLGHPLLQTAINYLVEQQATVNLTVIEKNEKALKLYEKNGFEIKEVLNYWTQL